MRTRRSEKSDNFQFLSVVDRGGKKLLSSKNRHFVSDYCNQKQKLEAYPRFNKWGTKHGEREERGAEGWVWEGVSTLPTG